MTSSRKISRIEPDAMALRALAHPQRMRMLGMLRMDGPATATGLAARLGMNSGATSYHLRQLARHGFIVEDEERGSARDRWWKAAHESTVFHTDGSDDETLDASIAFAEAALQAQIGQMKQALARHVTLPEEWRAASTLSDLSIPLSAPEARALVERLNQVIAAAMETAPKLGGPYPPGVEPFTIMLHAFPHPPEEDAE
ncbi:transcriptional regulator, ArsR family [Devosia lucknowensis]|uniref:Transcriptional regulator, ArsR family n=1 Tax=Devosia lucknowensis TaxID=1096929 RepID=A0A1Y6ET48_9HYPH|nr:helix-turn-helix domain-containing protein [Devosia lucknowensis]SMQ65399.1 transcriptional regulator, ArsR family [Devosia lucknowensis]